MRTMQVDNFVERQIVAKQPPYYAIAQLIGLRHYGSADYQRWIATRDSEQAVGLTLSALDSHYYDYTGFPLKALNPTSGAQDMDHVLIGPTGVYVIEAKNWEGRITFDDSRSEWRRSKLGDQPVIERSPSVDVKRGALLLRSQLNVEIKPLIVFTKPSAELVDMEHETNGVTVVKLANLIEYVLTQPEVFDDAKVNALVSELDMRVATWKATAAPTPVPTNNRRLWPIGAAIGVIALIVLILIVSHGSSGGSPVASGSKPSGGQNSAGSTTGAVSNANPPTLEPLISTNADTIGLYRDGSFFLRLSNSTGPANITVAFSPAATPAPIGGDWTGSGHDTIGVFDKSTATFTLCKSNDASKCSDSANLIQFKFGRAGDEPLSGRWDTSQTADGIGVFHAPTVTFLLKNALGTGNADYTMTLGVPGDVGVAGDWTGKGYSGVGVYRLGTGIFYLGSKVSNGTVHPDLTFRYAVAGRISLAGDIPIAGDWTGSGRAGIGLFRLETGDVFLRNELTAGDPDLTFKYGQNGDLPVVGHWALP